MKRKIVTLCGSTRFYKSFQEANYRLTMEGQIVLSVGFFMHAGREAHGERRGCTPEQKEALDALHLDKISMSDGIFVLNAGGYIGESTTREIAWALGNGKAVHFAEPVAGEAFLEQNAHRLGAIMAEQLRAASA